MTKIAFFLPSPTGGGAEKVYVTLADYFANQGIETDLILIDQQGNSFTNNEFNTVELSCSRIRYAIRPLIKYLNTNNPNAVFSTLTGANIISIIAGKFSSTNTKIIIREASVRSSAASSISGTKNRFMNYGIRYLYPRADRIIAISEGAGEDLSKFLVSGEDKIVTIPNPLDIDKIHDQANKPVNHEWFNRDYNLIIGVGRLEPVKDFETLILAFEEFATSNQDKLVLLGKGSEREQLQELIKERNISGIDFLGYVNNPYRYMKRADVFVSTSQYEGFGNAIVEALACGTPVIATDCPGGPSEILDGGKYGDLAPVGDSNRIAQLIDNVMSREVNSEILVSRASRYSIDSVGSEYIQLVEEESKN